MIICGTGHRPKSLPCGYDESHRWALSIKSDIDKFLSNNDIKCIISGMALGFDTWLAEAAMKFRIPLHCYLPFEGQESKWPYQAKNRYNYIVKSANHVNITSNGGYSSKAMLDRNIEMVDASDLVLALCDLRKDHSGTHHAINYAKKQNKRVVNLWKN